jgi:thiol-disulfide isomerase/thioredoxin
MRQNLYLTITSFLVFLSIIACSDKTVTTVSQERNKQAEYLEYNLALKSIEGESISLNNFKNKVLFLNIWATWCPPCRKEMPSIEALKNRFDQNEVQFILISPEKSDIITDYLNQTQLHLPVYRIEQNLPSVLHDEYIPRTYIIDRFGQIVHKHVGERDWNTDEIYEFLSFLAGARIKQ